MPDEITQPYALSETLLDELAALDPGATAPPDLLPIRDDQGRVIEENEKPRRRQIYGMAYARGLSALSLSGGGIRSAAFSLGIIQALADCDLLQKFNYLSTVSGGGYIGSWLSAWLYHSGDADQVLHQLRSRRADPDSEPPAIDHLREYSSYLTPKVGLLSADTWAAVAIVLRNIVLNWLILLPAVALPVVAIKLLAALVHTAPSSGDWWVAGLVAAACLVLGSMSLGYKLLRLYSDEPVTNAQEAQRRFLLWSLTPAIAAGACFTWLADQGWTPADALVAIIHAGGTTPAPSWWSMAVFALIIYAGALLGDVLNYKVGPFHPVRDDLVAWAAAVVVFASVVWLGTQLYASYGTPRSVPGELVLVIFGIPWFLLATLLAQTTYLMLRSYSSRGDVEREWLGRASGWHFIAELVCGAIRSGAARAKALFRRGRHRVASRAMDAGGRRHLWLGDRPSRQEQRDTGSGCGRRLERLRLQCRVGAGRSAVRCHFVDPFLGSLRLDPFRARSGVLSAGHRCGESPRHAASGAGSASGSSLSPPSWSPASS